MRRVVVPLLAAVTMIAALTWGVCAPLVQTRCIVDESGISLGWSSLGGWTAHAEIVPGISVRTWGMVEWRNIYWIYEERGWFGTNLHVIYSASGESRTADIGPLDEQCARAVVERLELYPVFCAAGNSCD